MARFSDIMDRKLEDVKRPPNLPVGHYTWQIIKHPDLNDGVTREGVPYDRVTFSATPVEPGNDVDADELEAFGPIQKTQVRKQFFIPDSDADNAGHERGVYNLKRFLSHCGIAEDAALSEALANSVNAQFFGELVHKPDQEDPEVIYQEIGRTALPE